MEGSTLFCVRSASERVEKKKKLWFVRIFASSVRASETRRGFHSVTVGGILVPVTTVTSTLR